MYHNYVYNWLTIIISDEYFNYDSNKDFFFQVIASWAIFT